MTHSTYVLFVCFQLFGVFDTCQELLAPSVPKQLLHSYTSPV